ncbi:inositol polyphosphate kinase KCS1 KNAG_0H01400 [Huiozyma naganishii CBS 8797]|uniref:Kinase n=1 Tax=Huiozyma naganishii (strain ATCC MYA-139 / BCRC 22969 / CBS 8797 / KCTC 17520 / NBRC 10181 / NCYC 3082 / Yp74L-3) TaxID=1071383 RepID=J7RPE3_HUIN7|nr:hypothetical protein KNAG_0H01400 [Kazachstania naganishii CBS 8797]CCK71553.1 hypothetical protein KNAG_0H01400 [Kazachstania naganishii CBS 8797]
MGSGTHGPADQNLQAVVSDDLASLKDLNVEDTKRLSPVLHGRKASTYLGIFRDNDPLQESGTTPAGDDDDDGAVVANGQVPGRGNVTRNSLQQRRRNSYKNSRYRPMASSHSKAGKIVNPLTHRIDISRGYAPLGGTTAGLVSPPRPQRRYSKGNGTAATSTATTNNQVDDLSLKPVSSATYYPHRSKSSSGTTAAAAAAAVEAINDQLDEQQQQQQHMDNRPREVLEPLRLDNNSGEDKVSATVVESRTSGEPTIEGAEGAPAGSASEQDVDEDADEEDKEYPLAVELKPFTNKVGGHTAIFRFSKRAVCKTLVNRENKWYETMELTNNNLLRFMPKYIGVLNVRQHFNSREHFLSQLPAEQERSKKSDRPQFSPSFAENSECNPSTNLMGAPLEHIHSFPTESSSRPIPMADHRGDHHKSFYNENMLPEVSIDDNKHIIPDSLWGRGFLSTGKSESSSPSSAPDDSYLSPENFEGKMGGRRDSGSTMLNTKLRDLIIQEVFRPVPSRKSSTHAYSNSSVEAPIRTISGRQYLKKKIRSSSSSSYDGKNSTRDNDGNRDECPRVENERRDSNISLREVQEAKSPLLQKLKKESLSNAVDASHSVMDLTQFHKKEKIREKLLNTEDKVTGDNDDEAQRRTPDGEFGNVGSPPPISLESITLEEHTDTIVSKFILLEDLTRNMKHPCALDLKMGTRQYGVDASATKQRSQRMKCQKTTSRRLGVRICGLKIWNQSYYIKRDKYFGRRVKCGWQFVRILSRFLYDGSHVGSIVRHIPHLIKKLDMLAVEVTNLKGFRLYGASILLMYDGKADTKQRKVKVNLIDFAKCVTRDDVVDNLVSGSFKIPPKHGDLEDLGFVRGVKSLKFYLTVIWNYLTMDEPIAYTDEDLANLIDNSAERKGKELFKLPWDWLDEFDKESEADFNDPNSELRKKWRKYELIFDVEPRYNNDQDVSD